MVLSLSAVYVSTSFTDFSSSHTAKGEETFAEQIKKQNTTPVKDSTSHFNNSFVLFGGQHRGVVCSFAKCSALLAF